MIFRDLTSNKATSTCIKLANKAFSYLFTAINTTETTTLNTDSFVYNTSTKSCYTSTVFIGIIIDTGALRKSTASYSQFQALQLTDPLVQLDTSTKGQVSI